MMAESMHVIVVVSFNLLVFITGTIGNSLVLYVYTKKAVQSSTTIFIRTLAFSDLLACLLRLGAVYHWTHQTDYAIAFLCPLFLSSSFFSVYSSACFTTAIAVDRFFAVCRAGRRGITPFLAKVTSAACMGIAVCVSAPLFHVFGIVHVPPDITYCGTVNPFPTMVIQRLIIQLIYISSLLIIIVMYVRVFMTIRSKAKVLASHQVIRSNTVDTAGASTSVYGVTGKVQKGDSSMTEGGMDPQSDKQENEGQFGERSAPCQVKESNEGRVSAQGSNNEPNEQEACANVISTKMSSRAGETETAPMDGARNVHRVRMQQRTTTMLLMTTAVLFLTWLPSVILRLLSRQKAAAIKGIGETALTLFILGEYLFFINNAINPVIYAFVNRRFREDCVKIITRLKRKILARNT